MTDIALYRGTTPESVTLTGVYEEDGRTWVRGVFLRDIEALYIVRVNGVASDLAVLSSSRDFQVRVPAGVTSPYTVSARAVRSLRPGERTLSALGFGYKTEIATPVEEALQRMQRFLLKTPGSDPWHRQDGGGLLKLSRSLYEDESALSSAVDRACTKYNERAAAIAPRNAPNVIRVQPTSVRVTTMEQVRSVLGEEELTTIRDRERVLFIALRSRLSLPGSQPISIGSVISV